MTMFIRAREKNCSWKVVERSVSITHSTSWRRWKWFKFLVLCSKLQESGWWSLFSGHSEARLGRAVTEPSKRSVGVLVSVYSPSLLSVLGYWHGGLCGMCVPMHWLSQSGIIEFVQSIFRNRCRQIAHRKRNAEVGRKQPSHSSQGHFQQLALSIGC